MRGRLILTYTLGSVEALLLARLLMRLLAARPDNPFVRLLLALTAPPLAPLAFLDAGQPRYGATLELSTLSLALLIGLLGVGVWLLRRRRVGQRSNI